MEWIINVLGCADGYFRIIFMLGFTDGTIDF